MVYYEYTPVVHLSIQALKQLHFFMNSTGSLARELSASSPVAHHGGMNRKTFLTVASVIGLAVGTIAALFPLACRHSHSPGLGAAPSPPPPAQPPPEPPPEHAPATHIPLAHVG